MNDSKIKHGNERLLPLEENRKNNNKVQQMILYGIFAAILIFSFVVVISQQNKKQNNDLNTIKDGEIEQEITTEEDKPLLAVIVRMDLLAGTIALQDIRNGQEIVVPYTGGTDIIDKYEQIMTAPQLSIGEVVDAYFHNDKLVKLQVSDQVWEYSGVNKWSIDTYENIFTIADTKYKYTNNLVVAGNNEIIDIFDLNEKDQLTIKGNEKDIYSIVVTKGHGVIRLEEYDDFVGGTAYIGNRETLPVEDDMYIMVREGTHEIILEKDNFIGYKTVEVKRDETVVVNMGEFKKPIVQTGFVKFEILPYGADLYIDDELKDYDVAMELTYGEHTIRAELGGYTPYNGTLGLGDSSKTITIDLAESTLTESTEDGTNVNNADTAGIDDNESADGTDDNESTDGTDDITEGTAAADDTSGTDSNNSEADQAGETDAEYIYVQSPVGVSVYFNAEYKGTAPVKFPKVTGTHYIILIKSGYQTQTHTVEIKDDGKDVYYNFQDMVTG
ncbi:MAG: hypothetical protein K0R92_3288 [Lachnospiraceae bacterium]|jgi:hypothetical protein|nr:hypothetical protein [Lachnospiraceae bacterium]